MTAAGSTTAPPAATTATPFVRLHHISKSFAGARALTDVSLDLRLGEIHALVGENGAGKSTLSKVLYGVHAPDEGTVDREGTDRDGITMVHQELTVIPTLSVAENVLMGIEPARGLFIDRRRQNERAQEYLARVGLDIDPRRSAGTLSVSGQQLVEIARALARDAQLIILDEPTSSLGREDARRLVGLMRELRDAGHGIVLISHDLGEVLEVADRVTVLRDGRLVASDAASAFDEDGLIRHMIGRDVSAVYERHATTSADAGAAPALRVRGLAAPGVLGASLEVRPGEVLGVAGLVGSGRSELLAAISGATRATAGEMQLFGERYTPRAPSDAIRRGIGLVPESRKDQGLCLGLSVRHNVELAALDSVARGPWLRTTRGRALYDGYAGRLRIKAANPGVAVSTLSGGNQQKVVLAKILATTPRVLLLDEPTRGIDVGAKAEVHRLVRELAESGLAIVMVSSVLQELLLTADRIVVMRSGRTVGELDAAAADEEAVLSYAFKG
ncbi:sugar ABC transporter ATP-binding protein [Pseudonocardia sp.]|uniref:sugar ABC transporter ATP-binding protein n=1 Tax=Pseudonocardia sp. TaxID=60912 RepID=UPI003D13584E